MTTFMAFGLVVGRLFLMTLLGQPAGVAAPAAPTMALKDTAAAPVAAPAETMGGLAAVLPRDVLPAVGSRRFATERGFATSFGGAADALAGGAMACNGRYMKTTDRICAHRTLPCGTVVLVQSLRTRKVASCVVMDRGPYGAELPNGDIVLKVKASEEGTWRGVIDLSPAVATSIGLTGRERVTLIYSKVRERKRPGAQIRWAQAGQRPMLVASR